MGLENFDVAGQVLPLTPVKVSELDLETSSNSVSPAASGVLTLPTVLQDTSSLAQRPLPSSTNPTGGNENIESARTISLIDPFAQSKLFLPILPKPIFGLNGLKWLSENPLRQRGLRFRPEEDPQSFVMCQLCGNSILANREINLQNHARRHSTLKQFQCCYCHYVHSEITKVRLHMAHNHNDNYSRPINNVNSEMRESWRALMNDCFPGHPFVNDQLQRRYTQYAAAAAAAAAIQLQRLKPNVEYSTQLRYRPY